MPAIGKGRDDDIVVGEVNQDGHEPGYDADVPHRALTDEGPEREAVAIRRREAGTDGSGGRHLAKRRGTHHLAVDQGAHPPDEIRRVRAQASGADNGVRPGAAQRPQQVGTIDESISNGAFGGAHDPLRRAPTGRSEAERFKKVFARYRSWVTPVTCSMAAASRK